MILLRRLGRYLKKFEKGRRRFFENMDKFNERDDLPYDFNKRPGRINKKDDDEDDEE